MEPFRISDIDGQCVRVITSPGRAYVGFEDLRMGSCGVVSYR